MDISKFKLIVSFIFGGGTGVIEYALGVINRALNGIGEANRAKIQGALNLALKVLSVLTAVRILVATKWQTAYGKTVESVEAVVTALSDLNITNDELVIVSDKLKAAIDAWKQPDDETCVDCRAVASVVLAVVVSAVLCGCAYKGAKVTEGTDLAIGVNVPGSEGTLQFQLLNYLSGFRLAVDRNATLKCRYTVSENNDYLGIVTTRTAKTMDAEVEPCETSDVRRE